MAAHMIFKIEVTEVTEGWSVTVDAGEGTYAEVGCTRLDVALRMIVPYLRSAVQPDPLEDLFRAPSAPDGPPEMP